MNVVSNTMQWPQAGLGSVGSYQMGGIPYLTASLNVPATGTLKIEFPYVAKFVTVVSNVGSVRVGFSSAGISGSGSNYFVLQQGVSYTGEWRVEDLFLVSDTTASATASIIAGLTPIPRGVPSFLTDGTGNNWSGSAGVG